MNTPEVTAINRMNLSKAYSDLLKVSGLDRTKLLEGIKSLGGIDSSNIDEFNNLAAEEIVSRINLTIEELAPQAVEYSHGQVAETTTAVQANTAKQVLESLQVNNEKGVPIEAITTFVDGLTFAFSVPKEKVLARLQTALTPEKMRQLQYFKDKGHGLEVPSITSAGEVEFASCSEKAPTGHRKMNLFDAQDLLSTPEFAGVKLMNRMQCKSLLDRGAKLDTEDTWSYLESPDAGTREKPGRAVYCNVGGVGEDSYPWDSSDNGAIRVWLRV